MARNEFDEIDDRPPRWEPTPEQIAASAAEIRARNIAATLDQDAPAVIDAAERERRRRDRKAYGAAYRAKKRVEKLEKLKQRQ